MYNRYLYPGIELNSVFVIGDIHGNFNILKYNIKNYDIRDSVMIIAGDCGFGFEKKEYYTSLYNSQKKVLTDRNVTILFIRGNHDDPAYFDGKTIDFKYWKAIPDYSVLTFGNKNILCVGGAISVDRGWRKSVDMQTKLKYGTKKENYWKGETPIYKPGILDEINNDKLDINVVVAHTNPNFVPPLTKEGISDFIENDSDLDKDTDYERIVMTNIYNHLLKNKNNLSIWINGHFHEHTLFESKEKVQFRTLDMARISNNSLDYYKF